MLDRTPKWARQMFEEALLGPNGPVDNRPGAKLMREFLAARKAGRSPPEDTLNAIAEAFRRILAGEPAEKALQLTRPAHRTRAWALEFRDLLATMTLAELRVSMTVEDAITETARRLQIPRTIVERVHKERVAGREFPKKKKGKK